MKAEDNNYKLKYNDMKRIKLFKRYIYMTKSFQIGKKNRVFFSFMDWDDRLISFDIDFDKRFKSCSISFDILKFSIKIYINEYLPF